MRALYLTSALNSGSRTNVCSPRVRIVPRVHSRNDDYKSFFSPSRGELLRFPLKETSQHHVALKRFTRKEYFPQKSRNKDRKSSQLLQKEPDAEHKGNFSDSWRWFDRVRFSTTGIEGGPNLSQFDLERLIWMYFSWLHSSAIVGVTVQDKRREIASLSSGSISNVQRALGNSFGKRSGKLRFSLECTPLLSRFRSRFQCRRNIEALLEPVHFRHARK